MATEKSLRKKVATWLDDYIGIKEGSARHQELIDIFNDSKLCSRYKMSVSDPWCALAVSDAFIANGLTDIFPCVECSCNNMITMAQSAGIWVEDDAYVPGIGDVMLYDWDDSGKGDNTGVPDHVGIVQDVSGTTITVIEGNKSDSVGTRTMTVNGQYIRGYITPDYKSKADGKEVVIEPAGTKTVDEIAQEVIAGQWGNGDARRTSLICAGYDYDAVQTRVNELLGVASSKSTASTSASSKVVGAQSFETGYGAGKKYKVTASSGLNMRYGPSTKHSVIKALSYGSYVMYYGYYDKDSSGDKWLLVIADGVTGWVNAKYVA